MSQRIILCKITLLVAWPADDTTATEAGLESLGDTLAEQVRDLGALTVASEYDIETVEVPDDGPGDDADVIGNALAARFPPEPPAAGRCGDEASDTDHTYVCTLPAGHDGDHVMTTHPLHPAWPRV